MFGCSTNVPVICFSWYLVDVRLIIQQEWTWKDGQKNIESIHVLFCCFFCFGREWDNSPFVIAFLGISKRACVFFFFVAYILKNTGNFARVFEILCYSKQVSASQTKELEISTVLVFGCQ